MRTSVKISTLALLFLTACFFSNVKAQDLASTSTSASVSKAISADLKALQTDFNNQNADAVSSHYDKDAIMTVEDGTAVRGSEAIRDWYSEAFKTFSKPTLEITVTDIVVLSETAAQTTGTYRVSFTDTETGKVQEVNGTVSLLSTKSDDGSWKIVRELDSAAAPTPTRDSDGGIIKH